MRTLPVCVTMVMRVRALEEESVETESARTGPSRAAVAKARPDTGLPALASYVQALTMRSPSAAEMKVVSLSHSRCVTGEACPVKVARRALSEEAASFKLML